MTKETNRNASHTATTNLACIMLVEDLTTGSMDGTMTQGGLILVTGHNIKLDTESETKDAILFINNEGKVTTVDTPLLKNEPEQLIFNLPFSLEADEYVFRIIKTFHDEKEQPSVPTVALTYLLKLEVQSPCMAFINCSPSPMV